MYPHPQTKWGSIFFHADFKIDLWSDSASPSVIFVRFCSPLHAGTSVATAFNLCVAPTNIPSPLLRPPPSCFPLRHDCHLPIIYPLVIDSKLSSSYIHRQNFRNVEMKEVSELKKISKLAETVTIHFCWGILVRLVMCVMVGHRKLKIEIIKLLTILC